jgi:hypothetical protein
VLLQLPPGLTFFSISHNHQHLDVSQLLAAAAAAAQDSVMEAASYEQPGGSNASMDTSQQQQQQQRQRQQQAGGLRHLEVSGLALRQPHLLTGLQALTKLVAEELKVRAAATAACRPCGVAVMQQQGQQQEGEEEQQQQQQQGLRALRQHWLLND